MDLDRIADELYALDPDEFTAARDDAAKRADDPALKKAVKALRKPTVAAHVVNTLVRHRPDDVDALLDVGDDLRSAMSGRGGDVRRLSEQRRDLISDLVPVELTAAVAADVTATLEAATADPDLGAAVRSGRLVKPLRYAGFGATPDLDDVVATAVPARPRRTSKQAASAKPRSTKSATEKAQPDLAAKRQQVLELSGVADDAQRRYDEASRAVVEARKVLDRAEAERSEAHKAARAAHAAAEKARRELGRLERG